MDAAVENPAAKIVSPLGWRKVSPWIMAFLAQWLILTVAYVLLQYSGFDPNDLFRSLFGRWLADLIAPPLFFLWVLGTAWLIVLSLRKIFPGTIRNLIPGALDKHLLPPPKETEIESILSERAKLTPDDVAVAERLAVMLQIRERVRRLRLRTTGILATMGVALIGAAIIVVFAGRLTSIDATAVSNVDKVKSDLAEEQRQLNRLYQQQAQLGAIEQARKEGRASDAERLERQLYGGSSSSSSLPTDVSGVQGMIHDGTQRIANLNTLLEAAWKKELETQH